jgi:PIN domain nuclease of toxin-antitoxin system
LASSDTHLLLDTHIIVWMATGDPRLKLVDRTVLKDPSFRLCVSSVVAFELTDLQQRGRIAMIEPLDFLQANMGFDLIDFPASAWRIASTLPDIHRDPVDRMLIAHAMAENMTLVTADANIRRYPVPYI